MRFINNYWYFETYTAQGGFQKGMKTEWGGCGVIKNKERLKHLFLCCKKGKFDIVCLIDNKFYMKKLRNRYFILRHGESKANVANILLSHPKEGIVSFGLSPKGKKQVQVSVSKNKKSGLLGSDIIIYSSDFLRAKETAQIARKLLGIKKINFHKNLRERYFGKFDKTSLDNIKIAWEHDAKNPDHKHKGVESPNKVLKRTLALIARLEKKYKGKKILLVSHGDVLQILHTHASGKSVSQHRQIPHLETAEIREIAF